MLNYRVSDLQDENDWWNTDLYGVKEFLGQIWLEDDEEMFEEIHSDSISYDRLKVIALGVGYLLEKRQ